MLQRTISLGATALITSARASVKITALPLALVLAASLTTQLANAASVCNKVTHTKYGEIRARFGPTLASVRQDGSTHAVIYHLNAKAPLGWSHSLRIWKNGPEREWRLQLVAVKPMANTNHPFVLQIDREPELTFAKPHIKTPQSTNEYELTSKDGLLRQTIDASKAGNRLKWRYTSQINSKENIVFSLSGLTAALRWLDCAQTFIKSSNVPLVSGNRAGKKQCQNNYISCAQRTPPDYQGHPGREANWKAKCEAIRAKCIHQTSSAGNAHWCNRNNLNVSERLICKSGSLRKLDAQLTKTYNSTTKDIATQGRAYERLPLLKKQQVEWIKKRNRCGAKLECLTRSYEVRILELTGSHSSPAFVSK